MIRFVILYVSIFVIMEVFKEKCLELIKTYEAAQTSKVIQREKYDRLVKLLKGDLEDKNLRRQVKQRGYRLITLPDLGLKDVLAVSQKNGQKEMLLRVVSTDTMFDVVQAAHTSNEQLHSGARKVEAHVKRDYYGVPRSYIRFHVKECPTCQLASHQTTKPPLKPIIEKEFLSRIQVDLIDLRQAPDGEYNYICHVVDHFTKFHVLYPLKTKSASEVAASLQERVFAYLGLPKIFHSDNGREFVNELLKSLFEQWGGDTIYPALKRRQPNYSWTCRSNPANHKIMATA